jgi:hypothetical protein
LELFFWLLLIRLRAAAVNFRYRNDFFG